MDITIVTLSPHELINDETWTELLIGQLFEFQVDIFKSTWHEIGIDSNWFTKVVTEAIDLFHWTELNGMHNQVFEQWPPISPPTTWLLLHLIQSASLYVYTPSPAPTPLHSRAVGCPDPPSIRTHLSYIHCFLLSLLFFLCVLSFAFYLFRVTRLSSILSTRVALNSFFIFFWFLCCHGRSPLPFGWEIRSGPTTLLFYHNWKCLDNKALITYSRRRPSENVEID